MRTRTRTNIVLIAKFNYCPSYFCSISEATYLSYRSCLSKGSIMSKQHVWQQILSHSQTGSTGFERKPRLEASDADSGRFLGRAIPLGVFGQTLKGCFHCI